MYNILAIFGKSGVGKDTLLKAIEKEYSKETHTIVSYTTRPKRDGEKDGINYHFISEKNFLDMMTQNRFLETSQFNNWYYGTGIDALRTSKINIGVFNPQGIHFLIQRSQKEKDICVYPILLECTDKERLIRALNRENTPDINEIIRRYYADEKDFNNFNELYGSPSSSLQFIRYMNMEEEPLTKIKIQNLMDDAIKIFNFKNHIL